MNLVSNPFLSLSPYRSDNVDLVEKVLAIYNMALTDHVFVLDYQNQFKVESDLELMRQTCLKM